jgi:N-methylhydantoinase A
VSGSTRPDPDELAGSFERLHEDRYGHRDPEGEVVLVHIRLAIVGAGPRLEPAAAAQGHLAEGARGVRFDGAWIETTVLRGEPTTGTSASGPVVFELPEATFVLPPGWSAEVDDAGTIRATVAK